MSFDKYATDWDTKRRKKRAEIIAKEIQSTLLKEKYSEVLELGCGTGLIGLNLLSVSDHLTLVDTSKEMIALVTKKIKDRELKMVTALQKNIVAEPLGQTYALIFSSMVLHHIPSIKK